MQVIELQAVIDENHQIHLQLPVDCPPQSAKVIVLFENINTPPVKKRQFGQFRGKIHIADDFNEEFPTSLGLKGVTS